MATTKQSDGDLIKLVLYRLRTTQYHLFYKNPAMTMHYLKVSVNEIINLEVFIIITPRIEKSFSNLDPTNVTNKLNYCEKGNIDNCKTKFTEINVKVSNMNTLVES